MVLNNFQKKSQLCLAILFVSNKVEYRSIEIVVWTLDFSKSKHMDSTVYDPFHMITSWNLACYYF